MSFAFFTHFGDIYVLTRRERTLKIQEVDIFIDTYNIIIYIKLKVLIASFWGIKIFYVFYR